MNRKLLNTGLLVLATSLVLSACAAPTPTAAPAKPTEAPNPAQPAAPAPSGKVLMFSTQANNVNESEALRKQVLAGAKPEVELVTDASGPFVDKLTAENKALMMR